MKKFPDSFIPSLRSKEDLTRWRETRDRRNTGVRNDHIWMVTGDRGLQEFANMAHELIPFLMDCVTRLQGKLKMVTFEGAHLEGTIALMDAFEGDCREQGIVPDAHLVDYSLTKTLGYQGLGGMGREDLLETGKVKLHIGPIEVASLKDAHNADVMISSMGPFVHAVELQHQLEMLVKVANELAVGGKAFLEIARAGSKVPEAHLQLLRESLGEQFTVELGFQKEDAKKWPGIVVIEKKEQVHHR